MPPKQTALLRTTALIAPLFRPDTSGSSSARTALQRLMMLRTLVTACTAMGTLLFDVFSPLAIPPVLLPGLLLAVLVSLVLVGWRLRQPWVVTSPELLGHLLIDVGFLLIILYFTGGASNPLISYLLVLLAVGATLLTQRFVSLFAALAIVLYTLFLVAELRTGELHAGHARAASDSFQLHLVGMWVIFVVSAILITVFITRMAAAIRSRELALAAVRESELRNEQLVAIGTLAAGTAHALGTPLSTMSVLLNELDREAAEVTGADIHLLREQVERCRSSLQQLTRFYNENSVAQKQQTLTQLRDNIQGYLVNMHPRAMVHFELDEMSADAFISTDMSLKHALINIIENAIKAARELVTVKFQRMADGALEISVRDDGPGIPAQVMENLGEPFISTRKGMGLGIFLANAAVERLNGTIRMFNLETGGALSIIQLPPKADVYAGSDKESDVGTKAGRTAETYHE